MFRIRNAFLDSLRDTSACKIGFFTGCHCLGSDLSDTSADKSAFFSELTGFLASTAYLAFLDSLADTSAAKLFSFVLPQAVRQGGKLIDPADLLWRPVVAR
jgi:hypothetical protein